MRIIGEPARMRILLLLNQHEATVQGVADELLMAHQSASKHLNVLYGAGVLTRARHGSSVRYSIADYTALRMIDQAKASITGYLEELTHLALEP
jgi:DNA-binding transcriptional ArsR family regulator